MVRKGPSKSGKQVYLYPSGFAGMALYFHKLANAIQKNGVDVTLFAYKNYELDYLPTLFQKRKVLSTGSLSFQYKQSRLIKIFRIAGARFHNLLLFYRAVIHDRPQIAHIQELFYPLDWILFYLLSKTSSRLVLTVHDVLPHKFYTRSFTFLEIKILHYIYQWADQLIVHSEANRRQLLSLFKVSPYKVIVIPHGEYSLKELDIDLSKKAAKKCLNLSPQDKVILFFGHIRQDKGLDILLHAFQGVLSREKQATLVIAGLPMQGESFEKYEQLINHLGLQSKVHCFLTYIDTKDIPKYFQAADFICLPYTRFFSQSGVLHLAQGFGRAVIVSEVGGLAEVISSGLNGLIVPPGNISKLQEAMIYLLKNPSICQKMGEEALRTSQEQFSWPRIAQKTIRLAYRLGDDIEGTMNPVMIHDKEAHSQANSHI